MKKWQANLFGIAAATVTGITVMAVQKYAYSAHYSGIRLSHLNMFGPLVASGAMGFGARNYARATALEFRRTFLVVGFAVSTITLAGSAAPLLHKPIRPLEMPSPRIACDGPRCLV